MRFLPVFFDLARGSVVLIGSGAPAVAKLRLLRAAGANVRWFADGDENARVRRDAGKIEIIAGEPSENDLAGALAVVSSAGNETDERVAALARAHNIPVNIVDRPDLSTFIFPAVVDRGDVVVAISTGGASPVLARRLREKIEAILPARIGAFAAWMHTYRQRLGELRERGVSIRRFWEKVIDGPVGAAFLSGAQEKADKALLREFETVSAANGSGVVHLVGAGPGDADLLTLRALQALQAADVIFYDELIGPEILDRARRDARQVFVGKRKGAPGIGQDAINRLLLEAAQSGQTVVRLKGGDPFIFGRGGEELEFLQAAGIQVNIVPGITAALGCAAEAGLPLTFRKEANKLTFLTANTAEGECVDWPSLADPRSTLVVYMGLSSAADVQKGLIGAGRAPQTPVAVLARGTRPDSRAVAGRLENLQTLAMSAGKGPALLVIGDAVAHSSIWKVEETRTIEVAA